MHMWLPVHTYDYMHEISILNGIKMWVFFGINIEKKHLCRHDKNYFCKSNILVINSIVGSGNMIKVSKIMSL